MEVTEYEEIKAQLRKLTELAGNAADPQLRAAAADVRAKVPDLDKSELQSFQVVMEFNAMLKAGEKLPDDLYLKLQEVVKFAIEDGVLPENLCDIDFNVPEEV